MSGGPAGARGRLFVLSASPLPTGEPDGAGRYGSTTFVSVRSSATKETALFDVLNQSSGVLVPLWLRYPTSTVGCSGRSRSPRPRTLRAIESGLDPVNIGIVASAMMMLDLGSLTALIQQQTPQLLSSTRSRVSAGKTRPDYDDF